MRVKFKSGNDIILAVIETVYYDEIEGEMQFFESGSNNPDYCISISQFDAVIKMGLLLENGFLDMIGYDLTYNVFEEETK